jgi:hypothetical protein
LDRNRPDDGIYNDVRHSRRFAHSGGLGIFKHLGYPEYLLPFIGIAKLLAVAAILAPGFHKLKEWAYAGLVFDLIGALYSHISVGDPASAWFFALIGLVLVVASYSLLQFRGKALERES